MTVLTLPLTDAEHQGFQDALGDCVHGSAAALPQDALLVLGAAGLRPTTSLVAVFVHSLVASFDEPLAFDPVQQLQAAYGAPNTTPNGGANPLRTVTLDITPALAPSVQVLLFCLFGPQMEQDAQDGDAPGLRAGKRMAQAIAQAFPNASSRLVPISLAYDDGTTQQAGF
jgi:hypothetical protein